MKKLITIFLVIVLVISLAACNKEPETIFGDNSAESTEHTGDMMESNINVDDAIRPTDPAHVHNYTAKVTAATCIDEGFTIYTCSCGDSYKSDKVAATGHKFGEWKTTKEPTTNDTGLAERKCVNCSTKETKTLGKVIANHTHNYTSKVAKNATCTQEGVKTFSCSCGESYIEMIVKTSHSYKTTTTDATCTNDGYATYKCSTCGDTYVDNRTNALGHSYKDNVVKPTCTANGYTKHTCSRCGISYMDTVINATGHAYAFTSDTATCTASGTRTETCSKCGNKKISTTSAFGHSLKTETVKATCIKDGYIKETCTTCGATVSSAVIDATGKHTYSIQVVADIANEYVQKNDLTFLKYINYTDWLVDRCTNCGYCVLSKMYFRYTEYDAAVIMLNYVNNLRAEVYGTHDYDLVLDATLLEWSKTRAKAIIEHYSHDGAPFSCGENICNSGCGIYDQFKGWKNSPEHYTNMINKDYKYFGYAFCNAGAGTSLVDMYGVQLFKP